ncbi:ATP-binding protein [Candidatus Solirubrobacter pratensis]|uniref:ATP-binding protein n=1 Tax=Candidatus Solirubrobacter pratensis TaxID=1298857 RepID=UPI0004257FA6|nr:AAA family ATPase [Candidatus Solirubrobacter pratensis]
MTALVGRERELEALRAGLRNRAGAALLVIEGAPGIGKTRLLLAAAGAARDGGARVLTARAGELERELPFGVIRQLLEPALSPELLTGAAALAAPALEPRPAPAPLVFDAPPGAAGFAVLHGLYWLIANLAAATPLVLAVDDLHWADAPSLRALAYVLARIEGVDAQLCVALRPHEPGADDALVAAVLRSAPSRVVRPGPLSLAATAALMGDADPEFVAACHTAAGGNPLLLGVHLRALAEAGVEPVAASAGLVSGIVPGGLAAAVRRRLQRIGPDATPVARALAVLGDDADPSHVAALAGVERAGDALEALQRSAVLARCRPPAFGHPLVRAAVAADIPAADRARLHRDAARALAAAGAEPERPAAHLLEVDPAGEAWVVDTLSAAADAAAARGAPEVAARLLRRALAEPPAPERRFALLMLAGGAEAQAGDPGAMAHLREAADAAPDPEARVTAVLALTCMLGVNGDLRGGVEVLQRELAGVGRADLRLSLEAELVNMARLDVATRPLALDVLARLPERLEGGRTGCMLNATLATEAVARGESRADAQELAERALAGGWLFDSAFQYAHPASVLMLVGRYAHARAAWDDFITRATRRGDVISVSWGHAFRAGVRWRAGALGDALADAELAIGVQELGLAASFALAYKAEALLLRGELAQAREALARAPAVGAQLNDALLLAARGRLHLAEGRAGQALEELREVGRLLERWEVANSTMAPWQAAAVQALVALGELDEAAALAGRAIEEARRWGDPWLLGQALRARALTAPAGARRAVLQDAAAILRDSEAELELACTLLALGACESGAAAREHLADALDLAVRCSSPALADQARAALVRAGARPRRAARSGRAALTATEERVARMAARGPTNREIAQALFVTEKTVEAHLSSAYRKLGIRARAELAAQLGV